MKIFRASKRSVVHIEAVLTSNRSSMTSEDFSDVYKYGGLQALFVTAISRPLQISVDLLCKKSYESSSLLGYFDFFQSNPTVGCCNINFSGLSQIRRGKICFASNVSVFLLYLLRECSCFVATFGQLFILQPPIFHLAPLIMIIAC